MVMWRPLRHDPATARGEGLVSQIIVRALLIVLVMGAALAAFAWLAARKADTLSIERQQHLITIVLEQNFRMIAHDQESSTVWDDSVKEMRRRPYDAQWLDDNLGIWFHTYYGHDEVFIVDAADQPIYAMRGGQRADPADYAAVAGGTAAPLIAELRGKMRHGIKVVRASSILTPGAIDLGIVHGHPAIISVKPIVSDTGALPQRPGSEHLHISIRYLDGSFVEDLASRYQLSDGHFAAVFPGELDGSTVALRTRSGKLIGYFAWRPFRPGTAMLQQLAPVLLAALLLVFAIAARLLYRISQATIQLSAARSLAQHLADHDPLTSLANRALFNRELQRRLSAAADGQRIAMLYVDLDHFKNVNDHLGHPTGDLLIIALSRILGELAPKDVVARLGGDEFAIIHAGSDVRISAEKLARAIHRTLTTPIALEDGEVLIGASIGIAIAPDDAVDAIELVRKADIALYDAKLAGRGRHSFYDEAMDVRVRERVEIQNDLRAAMATGRGLELAYEPLFAADTGELLGAEAQLRWRHPSGNIVMPDAFLSVAEESGLIERLNGWMLERACATAARWGSGVVTVNVSAIALRSPSFVERILGLLRRNALPAERLELAIPEESFTIANEQSRENLGWLADVGVHIVLAQFGQGYSSFAHLHRIEVDRIKIDKSLITMIDDGDRGRPVIKAIVETARSSGIQTSADGVASEVQRRFLIGIGCDMLQGPLLCEPLAEAGITGCFGRSPPFVARGGPDLRLVDPTS